MGRGFQEQVSTCSWKGYKLHITTIQSDPSANGGQGVMSEVKHILSFKKTRRMAHPPHLIIETPASAVMGGISSTTRTEYIRD